MKKQIQELEHLVEERGWEPWVVAPGIIGFERDLNLLGLEMPANCMAAVNIHSLQVRVPIPLILQDKKLERAVPMMQKLSFGLIAGSLVLDGEGGVIHACVSTKLSNSDTLASEFDYCLEAAETIGIEFGIFLLSEFFEKEKGEW